MIKLTDLSKVSFSDENILSINLDENRIEIKLTGYSLEDKSYGSECIFTIDGVEYCKIKQWDITKDQFMQYKKSISTLREINKISLIGNKCSLSGFTIESDWIEAEISAREIYLLILI